MISRRFENTKTINLFFIFTALLFGLFLYELFIFEDSWNVNHTLIRVGTSVVLLISMIFLNTIDRWNELTENNSYSIFFFGIFSIIFPHIYNNIALVTSNLLIIIATWRIMTLRTEENIPQKIFDASFLIICAGLFTVWAFIFLLNVWISLLYYGSKKRKYWLIPFVAIFCVGVLFSIILIVTKIPYQLPIDNLWQLDYQQMLFLPTRISLIIMAIMFIVSLIVYLFKSTYHSGSSQVIIQFLLVGLIVVFFSKEVIFVFAPLSILFALYIEKIEKFWLKETILWIFLAIPPSILLLHFIAKS
ncbi:MAG: DUF6427 family protein [Capnocytophaga sp.]|nr:DUF6427 family protein [Capnocytophaga sp.]